MEKIETKIFVLYAILILFILSFISGIFIILKFNKPFSEIKISKSFRPVKNGIGIIYISGPIRQNFSTNRFFKGGSENIIEQLRKFDKMDNIKAIILRINSPGGSVASVQEIYSEIIKIRNSGKIVVASLGEVAASGGYYIASACNKIVANPGTITGSIGVIFQTNNLDGLLKKIGIKTYIIKSGKFKDSGSFFRELTEEERQIFQSIIDDAYNQFIQAIINGRGMKKDNLLPIADGRIYTGTQAFKIGLVDALGNDSDAIELAKQLANIKGKPDIVKEISPIEDFLSMFSQRTTFNNIDEILSKTKIRFEYIFE